MLQPTYKPTSARRSAPSSKGTVPMIITSDVVAAELHQMAINCTGCDFPAHDCPPESDWFADCNGCLQHALHHAAIWLARLLTITGSSIC